MKITSTRKEKELLRLTDIPAKFHSDFEYTFLENAE